MHAVVQHVKGFGIISVETLREIVSGNLLCIVLEGHGVSSGLNWCTIDMLIGVDLEPRVVVRMQMG